MKKLIIAPLLFCCVFSLFAQNFEYKWVRVPIDSTYDRSVENPVAKLVEKYSAGMGDIMEIIAYSSDEMTKGRPESGLSNLAADALLFGAQPFLNKGDAVLSVTNYGGIRADFPKGAIRVYDILSVFPFDNSLVIVDVSGKDLIKFFDRFAAREYFEALGNVEIVLKDNKYKKLYVNGAPIDPNRTYKIVTIDFLLGGGDSMDIKSMAKNVVETGLFIRDIVIDYMKDLTSKGVVFKNQGDSRIIIEK